LTTQAAPRVNVPTLFGMTEHGEGGPRLFI
jgi:hypothetical protein